MLEKLKRFGRRDNAALKTFCVIAGFFLALFVSASVLPLAETNAWWVRYLDFVRLQLLLLVVVLMALLLLFGGWRRWWGLGLLVLGAAAAGYHVYRVHSYGPLVAPMAVGVPECPPGAQFGVMVANVKQSNRQAEQFLEIVEQTDPHLLVILETDPWWNEALQPLQARFPHREQYVPQSGGEDSGAFGMHLLSRLPLIEAETFFYFGADTPTIIADVELPDGSLVQIVALHPRPPIYWSQPTTMRDAHLLMAALEARDAEHPSVVAGDRNAVPWERITRRAMRIGELLDPRVRRGVYPTYHTESWLMSWPLDQILFQDRLGLSGWRVLPSFGSDHLPVFASLCMLPDLANRQNPPPLKADDIKEAETALNAAQAMDN